jgi:hypothetical protein
MFRYPEAMDLPPKQVPLIMLIGLRLARIEAELSHDTHWSFIRRKAEQLSIYQQHKTNALSYCEYDLLHASSRIEEVKHKKAREVLNHWYIEVERLWDIAAAAIFSPPKLDLSEIY